MRKLVGGLALVIAGFGLSGCSGGESTSSCEAMVKTGAERGASMDDVDRALRACSSVEELEQAAEKHPELLGSVDAATIVSNRCEHNAELRDYPICG